MLAFINFSGTARAQTVYVVDQFNPTGTGGNSHSGGQIGNVWGNWTGLVVRFNPWSGIPPAPPAIIQAPAP